MARQARCWVCKVHYQWPRDYPLKGALCPRCRGGLDRTSYHQRQEKSAEAPVYA